MSRYVILCGGRDHPPFTDAHRAWLASLHQADPFVELVTGGGSGADTYGDRWAQARGIQRVTFWANWKGEGKRAGPQRNTRMLTYICAQAMERHDCRPLVIAFPGGSGTADMCRQAQQRGVQVVACPLPTAGGAL